MPLRLVSMAKTVNEKKDESRPMTDGVPGDKLPDYPYGLTINLSNEELKKLGYNHGELAAGVRCRGVFVGMITDAGANMVNGLPQYRASIQLQEVGIEPEPAEGDSRANTLYGGPRQGEA